MNKVSDLISESKEIMKLTENWQFRQKGQDSWLPAKVPGSVHTDLLANQQVNDPFYGKNELDQQWIDKQDWEYETTFDVPDKMWEHSNIELVFEGLDTYGDVYLNGKHILETNNMFRSWKADAKSILKKENNKLTVRFHSPVKVDIPKLKALGYDLPASNDHSEDGELGDQRISVFARKAPYHYGWDWGPRFVTSGIWKDVKLEGWSKARITDLYILQKDITQANAELAVKVEMESDKSFEGNLRIVTEGIQIDEQVKLVPGVNEVEIDVNIEKPKLWWSRGLGKQNMYVFTASLSDGEEVTAEHSVRTGLRSVKLVRENDEDGQSFYIELNGQPVFAKGANHIPNDSFVTEITYERYKHEIISAVESNMNMLRVWGGGIYEYDEFYELCDEYGIMVWQDFMFACSMYPGDKEFLENVNIEAEENIKRLRNNPSVVLWCGNNEIDSAWANYIEKAGWGWKQQYTSEQRAEMWESYEQIFHHVLADAVAKFSPTEPYWPSSPMSELTNDENQHANIKTGKGDLHYWAVWHGKEPFEEYNNNVGRFMSEYGFQSFPELKTVRTYAGEEELELESSAMLHHQKNGQGNQLIREYMKNYCPEPKDFPSFLYMSQVLQAEGIKTAIEAHRRQMPYCMGSLYWQMNDCWPVASWSSMDYYGRWKALQYYAKRSFKDIMVSIEEKDNHLSFYVVSDQLEAVSGEIHVQLLDFNGEVLNKCTKAYSVLPNSSTVVLDTKVEEFIKEYKHDQVLVEATLYNGDDLVDRKEHYLVPTKQLRLSTPTITVTEVEGTNGLTLELQTNILAKQVWLATDSEGIFSDNFFDLVPGIPKQVSFKSRENAYQEAQPNNLQIHSMTDFI